MRILITGASGLLGLNVALEAAREHTVVGVVNQHPLYGTPFQVIQRDLSLEHAIPSLLDHVRPDGVIHCAAQANVDQCELAPQMAMYLNAIVPGILAQETARRGLSMVHISTDAVFDGQKGDYCEEDAPNPLSAYARFKLEGEQRVLSANPGAAIARVNLFGWSLSGKRSLAEFFYSNLKEGRSVKGFIDVHFCPVLVNDLAWVLVGMLARRLGGVYHAVSPTCTTKYAFGQAIARLFGFPETLIEPVSVQAAGLAAPRSPCLTLNSHKLAQTMGCSLPSWEEGLQRFYRLHQDGFTARVRSFGKLQDIHIE